MVDNCTAGVELVDVFRELIPIADRWEDIGLGLRLQLPRLRVIRQDSFSIHSCLREMILDWLKGNGVHISWTSLIHALETVDEAVAKRLRDKYVTKGNRFQPS